MWSRYATLMLKTEIYLWSAKVKTENQLPDMNDIHTAEQALLKVIGKFSLLPEFTDIFNYAYKGNDEIIFAIRFADGEKTNWVENFVYSGSLKVQVYCVMSISGDYFLQWMMKIVEKEEHFLIVTMKMVHRQV